MTQCCGCRGRVRCERGGPWEEHCNFRRRSLLRKDGGRGGKVAPSHPAERLWVLLLRIGEEKAVIGGSIFPLRLGGRVEWVGASLSSAEGNPYGEGGTFRGVG